MKRQMKINSIQKPDSVPYPKNDIKYGHYGKIMENLIDAACNLSRKEKRKII